LKKYPQYIRSSSLIPVYSKMMSIGRLVIYKIRLSPLTKKAKVMQKARLRKLPCLFFPIQMGYPKVKSTQEWMTNSHWWESRGESVALLHTLSTLQCASTLIPVFKLSITMSGW